ncbi:MAG: ribosome silencing factor [Myxococcales bacterium]|nr:ribosome silencing factor [Myxococcales bacterium]
MALEAARAAQDKKGQNLTIINLEGRSSYADMLVIATAYSERQTLAIADAIHSTLKQQHNLHPMHREGHGAWILLDYGDIVVHVFHEDARAFYALDQLWADAPRVEVPVPLALNSAAMG